MSVKPCSSNSEHSHSADSTSASAVARPYWASRRLSSEPALTPILIGTQAADAARAISATLSSNALMFPGFTRTAAQPASIAAKTYLGWKWMSAMTGICDLRAMSGSASASSCDGTATRTIWQPGEPGPDPFVDHHRQVAAVQRQQREQVEGSHEDVQRGDDEQHQTGLGLPADPGLEHLASHVARADHAGDLPAGGVSAVLREQ